MPLFFLFLWELIEMGSEDRAKRRERNVFYDRLLQTGAAVQTELVIAAFPQVLDREASVH